MSRDVLALEKSVMELHQMFQDFAQLTEMQGELLDQIQYNVDAAKEFVGEGNVDLEGAIELQKSIRKKTCCIMITLVIIGVIVMAALGLFGQV